MVVRTLRARPGPLRGDDEMGLERFSQILGRGIVTLGDWMTRINKKIVGSGKLFLGGRIQGNRGRDELLEDIVFLVHFEEGLNFCADIEILCQLLGKVSESAVDEDLLCRGGHFVESSRDAVELEGDGDGNGNGDGNGVKRR